MYNKAKKIQTPCYIRINNNPIIDRTVYIEVYNDTNSPHEVYARHTYVPEEVVKDEVKIVYPGESVSFSFQIVGSPESQNSVSVYNKVLGFRVFCMNILKDGIINLSEIQNGLCRWYPQPPAST